MRADRRGRPAAPSVPELLAEVLRPPAAWPGAPWSAGEQVRARRAGACRRQSSSRRRARCAAPRAAQGDRQLGGVEHRAARRPPTASDERRLRTRLAQAFEHLLLAPPEQLGQHPVHDDGGEVDVGLRRATRSASSIVSLTGISSGAATITTPVCAGSLEDVEHPRGLVAHHADLHELADRLRAPRAAPTMWPAPRRRPHEVVVLARAPPSTSLPTVRISFTPGAALATKSKAAGERADAADERELAAGGSGTPCSDSSVSIAIAQRPRLHLARLEPGAAGLEAVGQVALGVDLARRACACRARGEQRRGPRRSVVLPTPPLPVTKSSLRSRRSTTTVLAPGTLASLWPPTARSAAEADPAVVVRAPISTYAILSEGTPTCAASAVGEPEHGSPSASAASTCCLERGRDRRRRPARCRAPSGWVTPMRTSTGPPRQGSASIVSRRSADRTPAPRASGAGCACAHRDGDTCPEIMPCQRGRVGERLADVADDDDEQGEDDPVVHERGAGAPRSGNGLNQCMIEPVASITGMAPATKTALSFWPALNLPATRPRGPTAVQPPPVVVVQRPDGARPGAARPPTARRRRAARGREQQPAVHVDRP